MPDKPQEPLTFLPTLVEQASEFRVTPTIAHSQLVTKPVNSNTPGALHPQSLLMFKNQPDTGNPNSEAIPQVRQQSQAHYTALLF